MNRKLNILNAFPRKALCIAFLLLIGFSFSVGSVLANSCQGGADCLNCAAAAHPHIQGMDLEMDNQGSQTTEKNKSCDFETGHNTDDFDNTAAVVKSGTHPSPGIFSATSDRSGQADLYREFITPFQNHYRSELTPIYLLNLSLLC